MKQEFKRGWKASKQARKQRKYRANAPQHTRGDFLNAPLSKELREKHQKRSLRVRSGDEVQVLRGQFKGESGAVENVDTDKAKLYIRGVELIKGDGTKTQYPVAASNVRITKLTDDKRRL